MAYMIRRIAKTHPSNVWQVIGLMSKICRGYESSGRSEAQIYFRGWRLPPSDNVAEVVAEWTQESIERNESYTDVILEDNEKLQEPLTEYPLEFYSIVTDEDLRQRRLLD